MQAEYIVIKSLLDEFISKTINIDCEIIEFPDESERNLPACDALARVGCRIVAIEHTSIDSILFQRRDGKRFMELLGPLESKLVGKLANAWPLSAPYNYERYTYGD